MAKRTPGLREDPALEPFVISSVAAAESEGKAAGTGGGGVKATLQKMHSAQISSAPHHARVQCLIAYYSRRFLQQTVQCEHGDLFTVNGLASYVHAAHFRAGCSSETEQSWRLSTVRLQL